MPFSESKRAKLTALLGPDEVRRLEDDAAAAADDMRYLGVGQKSLSFGGGVVGAVMQSLTPASSAKASSTSAKAYASLAPHAESVRVTTRRGTAAKASAPGTIASKIAASLTPAR